MSDQPVIKQLLRTAIREVLDGFGNKNAGKDGVGGNMRYDVPVRAGASSNILDDEDNELAQEKQSKLWAATVLCIDDDGKILAVSRRNDPTAFGLPGGKVDPGETAEQAAARELQEETGLTVTDLRPVFVREEGDGYTTTTFVGKVSGQIRTDEEGVVKWVDREVLFNGPFGGYNRKLFAKLGL